MPERKMRTDSVSWLRPSRFLRHVGALGLWNVCGMPQIATRVWLGVIGKGGIATVPLTSLWFLKARRWGDLLWWQRPARFDNGV